MYPLSCSDIGSLLCSLKDLLGLSLLQEFLPDGVMHEWGHNFNLQVRVEGRVIEGG